MSGRSQRTISRSVTLEGTGLHSGKAASVTFRPAEPDTGVRFRRTDLPGDPEVPASLDYVADTELGTTLRSGEASVLTVEHVLAALTALRVSNVVIEIRGPEIPICDGSFQDYVAALDEAAPVEQEMEADVLKVGEPVTVSTTPGQSYKATAGEGMRISATIDFEHATIGRQFGSFLLDEQGFREELAPARTFGFKADAERLHARGLALGASLDNAVVLDEVGVMNDGLRFEDEFLRHKVGDLIGDLSLLGARIDAHIVAERPSHAGNIALARALRSIATHPHGV